VLISLLYVELPLMKTHSALSRDIGRYMSDLYAFNMTRFVVAIEYNRTSVKYPSGGIFQTSTSIHLPISSFSII